MGKHTSTHNGTEHVRERTLPYHGPFLSSWRSVRFHGSHDGRDIPPPAALPLGDGRGCTRGSHTQLLVQQQQLPKRRQRTNHAAYRALRQRRRRESVALAPRSRRQGGGGDCQGRRDSALLAQPQRERPEGLRGAGRWQQDQLRRELVPSSSPCSPSEANWACSPPCQP